MLNKSAFSERVTIEKVQQIITHPGHLTLVAKNENGEFLGFVDSFKTEDQGLTRLELDLIAIESKHRGKGVGFLLVSSLLKQSSVFKAHVTRALVKASNSSMNKLMRKLDFSEDDKVCGLYVSIDASVRSPIALPKDSRLVHVHSMTYTGIWLEGSISTESIHAGQYERDVHNFDLVGAVVPLEQKDAIDCVEKAGFNHIEDYRWWYYKTLQEK